MADKRTFQCLRCEHRFEQEYDSKKVVERSCPKCGSNSVRPEPVKKAAGRPESAKSRKETDP